MNCRKSACLPLRTSAAQNNPYKLVHSVQSLLYLQSAGFALIKVSQFLDWQSSICKISWATGFFYPTDYIPKFVQSRLCAWFYKMRQRITVYSANAVEPHLLLTSRTAYLMLPETYPDIKASHSSHAFAIFTECPRIQLLLTPGHLQDSLDTISYSYLRDVLTKLTSQYPQVMPFGRTTIPPHDCWGVIYLRTPSVAELQAGLLNFHIYMTANQNQCFYTSVQYSSSAAHSEIKHSNACFKPAQGRWGQKLTRLFITYMITHSVTAQSSTERCLWPPGSRRKHERSFDLRPDISAPSPLRKKIVHPFPRQASALEWTTDGKRSCSQIQGRNLSWQSRCISWYKCRICSVLHLNWRI